MYIAEWSKEKGSVHLFRPDLLNVPSSSVILGVAVYGEDKTLPHAHADSDEWFLVVEGKGNVETDGQPNILTTGGTVYTPPYMWHSFQGLEGSFRILYGIYSWRTYTRPGECEAIVPVQGRKPLILSLKEARAEASGGKLSLTLLEPWNVGRVNCLGVNYCLYAPGTVVKAHAHEALEQVTYVASGRLKMGVEEEQKVLSKDNAVYVPVDAVHSLENAGDEPVAVVNAYYVSKHLWLGSVEPFFTKTNPCTEPSRLRYPSEI